MESDLLFEDSPLGRYIQDVAPDVVLSNETSFVPKESKDKKKKKCVLINSLKKMPLSLRLPWYNDFYQELMNDPDCFLEKDFPDVLSALREESKLDSRAIQGIVFLVVVLLVSYFWSWKFLPCLVLLFFWGKRKDEKGTLHELEQDVKSLGRLKASMRHSLSLIREVELVSRGFRVGLTVQSPLSLMCKEIRHLRLLRETFKESWLSYKLCVSKMLESFAKCQRLSLRNDVELVQQLVDGTTYMSSVQSMANICEVVNVVGVNVFVIALRGLLLEERAIKMEEFRKFGRFCEEYAMRFSDVRGVCRKWNVPVGKKTQKKELFASNAVSSLQSSLKTIDAKIVLLCDRKDEKEENLSEDALSILEDLKIAYVEWERFCNEDKKIEKIEEDRKFVLEAEVKTAHSNGLEIDVIGEVRKENEQQEIVNNLNKVIEFYLSSEGTKETDEDARENHKPKKSREERIKEMKQRKKDEEIRIEKTRTLDVLMSELENVLKKR